MTQKKLEGKNVKLPSGATLTVTLAPFAEAKALLNAVLKEVKDINMDPSLEMLDTNFIKSVFCAQMTSPDVEAALAVCMGRALYNRLKITEETFDAAEARQDYISVCLEVAKENLAPFVNGLSAKLSGVFQMIPKSPA